MMMMMYNSKDHLNQLKIITLENLKEIISKVDFKGRQLNKFLSNLQLILNEAKKCLVIILIMMII